MYTLSKKEIKSVIPYKTMIASTLWSKIGQNEVASSDGKYIIHYDTYSESFLTNSFTLYEISYENNIISNKKAICYTSLPFFYKNDLLKQAWESAK